MVYSLALAISIATSPCSWDHPGANRYKGDVPTAVHNYKDIPEATRKKLQARMEKHRYDDMAEIRRDGIKGKYEYTELRDMHFGTNQLCQSVTRDKWKLTDVERGLVYCEDSHCIIVPTVCGNVSRVTRQVPKSKEHVVAAPPGGSDSSAGSGRVVTQPPLKVIEHNQPIVIDPVDVKLPPLIIEHNSNFPFIDIRPSYGFYPPPIYTGPVIKPPISPVPEVSNFLAMSAGLLIILFWIKRRK